MNIPQSSYSMYFTQAILGMQAIAGEVGKKISRIAKGIIYYGRAVVQSRLYDGICRLPRQNKFTVTYSGGTTWTAGHITTLITHGYIKNGETDASTEVKTVTTNWSTNYATTLALHAADIKAALADCYSCEYAANVITFIGDCEDITAVASTVTASGAYDSTITGTPVVALTQDAVGDSIGFSFLTHNRQQQINGVTYYMDTEPVNIGHSITIWVYAEEAVKPSDTVYMRLITNSTKYAGYVGKSADSGKCVALTHAKFGATITVAGLVPLEVVFPQ
jgi:hypothetical protein